MPPEGTLLVHHRLIDGTVEVGNFQPMNVNFGIMTPLGYKVKGKANKNLAIAERSLAIIDQMVREHNV